MVKNRTPKSSSYIRRSPIWFRSGYPCETQLVTVVEDILVAMDQRCQVYVILLDLSKAFDTVPHQRLLKKLHNYGIRSNILKWISILG